MVTSNWDLHPDFLTRSWNFKEGTLYFDEGLHKAVGARMKETRAFQNTGIKFSM
jgi:hypothetical protein